ncbi:NnrU family protein [Rhodobacteraceae bacterium nBUS_22]|nr:NnrU family protein [Paracoccaceae bacterium]
MFLLIFGIALWIAAHVFKRFAPERRAAMGEKGKGPVAIGILAGLILMIIGYRSADFIAIWTPPAFLTHVNNLLMVLAVVLFAMSTTKGRMSGQMRHPMLTSVKTWAVAHLLVNGDLASIILFGSMFGWALWSVIKINRAEEWTPPDFTGAGRDWQFLSTAVIAFGVIVLAHWGLGVWPLGARG